MHWRIPLILILIAALLAFGFSLIEPSEGDAFNAVTEFDAPSPDLSQFARAIGAWDWQFPRDHGSHPDFQTEWWYYTGNLADEAGRRFGFQFTIFRRAIASAVDSASEFRASDIYMAHFTLSDIAQGVFYHDVRYSRGGAGLAGATTEPRYKVWLEDWQVYAENDDATLQRIMAASADFAIDLRLQQVKPPALQGDKGLSPKSAEIGNASYYYSLSRLVSAGSIRIGDRDFQARGLTWMDHEFSTSALSQDAGGWDWFGLIFDNETELMIGQIRQVDGSIEPNFGGLLIHPDGGTRYLGAQDFSIAVTDSWRSSHTGALYPAGWDVEILGPGGFSFSMTPLLADQELHGSAIQYWEGAVRISGDVSGYGYAELTGYAGSMQNRF